MANAVFIGILIIVIVIIIGIVIYYATAPSTTTSTSVSTMPTTSYSTTIKANAINKTALLGVYDSNTIPVNASRGGTVNAVAPDGVVLTATLAPGTYAKISNQTQQEYNFTLATFNVLNNSIGPPPGEAGTIAAYGFAFEINGQITTSISLVSNTGKPMPATTQTLYPTTWGSWAYIGGTFDSATGTYTGGSYAIQNAWIYGPNASYNTSGTMTNVQFSKPVMWVMTFNTNPATVSATTTIPYTTQTTTASTASTTARNTSSTTSTSTSTTSTGGYGGYG